MKSIAEQIKCAKRELAIRKKVYPYRLTQGKMKADEVRHEIECMEEIIITLGTIDAAMAEKELPLLETEPRSTTLTSHEEIQKDKT